jgi:NADPH:quinone reductase-like Zn-dependent oxidoreductase
MKAIVFTRYGGPEVMLYADVPDPIPQPGEVVVDVHAASVNAADCKIRGGLYNTKGSEEANLPYRLGRDFSGVVSYVDQEVGDFKVGDPVFGVLDRGVEGAYAEKLAIKASIIARKPDQLTHVEAAALALTGLTAIWAIEDTAHLRADETILIQGGAGGVASFAIQLAHYFGAKVITTASPENKEYVIGLGADRVINYKTEDFTKTIENCDVVFDTVGGEVHVRSYKVLKPGGRLVYIAAAPPGFQQVRHDIRVVRPAVTRDRAHLLRMLNLIANGAVKPPSIQRFKLSDAAEAHRISDSRHLQGKLVLEVI